VSATEPFPQSQCPGCQAWLDDCDGFGVLAHVKPYHEDGCGYCTHPSSTDGACCRLSASEDTQAAADTARGLR